MLTGEQRSTVERSRTVQWLGMTPISSRIKIEKCWRSCSGPEWHSCPPRIKIEKLLEVCSLLTFLGLSCLHVTIRHESACLSASLCSTLSHGGSSLINSQNNQSMLGLKCYNFFLIWAVKYRYSFLVYLDVFFFLRRFILLTLSL